MRLSTPLDERFTVYMPVAIRAIPVSSERVSRCYTYSQLIDDVLYQYEQHAEFVRLNAKATR
jgi:hypothetical protein